MRRLCEIRTTMDSSSHKYSNDSLKTNSYMFGLKDQAPLATSNRFVSKHTNIFMPSSKYMITISGTHLLPSFKKFPSNSHRFPRFSSFSIDDYHPLNQVFTVWLAYGCPSMSMSTTTFFLMLLNSNFRQQQASNSSNLFRAQQLNNPPSTHLLKLSTQNSALIQTTHLCLTSQARGIRIPKSIPYLPTFLDVPPALNV